ncbi:SusC/RagA family TonB-linked outer membrane protein [Flavobacterium algicola]|uniref:SusC/RagA family TonB-linked outer membrane protein n=1 Tax=Flavobacterium algicola TaxID=556529 RepID=UPI001EFD95DD|nr:SusC/RagA family TonB-linked outer membrane protein [Flavobacterium algicola]MCG9793086.1 SusC/RagA family TonB-linked outer membrane protein [Flavobacterium algicola]
MMKQTNDQLRLIKKTNLLWILALLISFMTNSGYASTTLIEQNKVITGTVISEDDNMGIPGVNVSVKGGKAGTVTDIDGKYSISVPANATLVFTYMGFTTQEIKVGSNSSINTTLKSDKNILDEVIVVGFGTQKKETLTGSVTQVKGDDILRGKGTSNATLALQGEVPGLVITRSSSRPGNEGTNIKIRGDISVNGIGPLILVDGLEIPEWQLATINPNDIESYSVLKDGAAAIYGTKAAGGVILVTTKKGKQGKMKVSYNGETQVNMAGKMPVAGMQKWGEMFVQTLKNDTFSYIDGNGATQQSTGTLRLGLTRENFESIANGTFPVAPDSFFLGGKDHRFAEVDQFDAVYGSTISKRHNLSVSGGNENATYRTSVSYANDRSPISFVYDGAKKYNFRTNVTYKVSDLIKTEFNMSYDNRIVDEPTLGVGESINDMNIFPLYNEQGQYYDIFGGNNILSRLDEGGRTITDEKIFRLGAKLILDLDQYVKGLTFTYFGNMSTRNGLRSERKKSVTNYDWDGNLGVSGNNLLNSYIKLYETKVNFQNHVLQANYQHSFGKHNFSTLLGFTSELQQSNRYYSSRSNMASDDLDDINTGDITTQITGGINYTQTNGSKFSSGSEALGLVSYIGKVNYDYDGIFLVEALGRRDGSSRLHPDYRWKNFYSGSAGVNLHKFDFVKDLNVFNNLKIYTSYGETASVTGIDAYDYISEISTGSTVFGATPTQSNTAWIAALRSIDRTWERVATTNYGVDFAVLDNRLKTVFEVFNRKNLGMLTSITYNQVLGATAPKTNSGDFTSNGWELSVNWKDNIGDFKYNVGVMVWDSKSKITRMDNTSAYAPGENKTVEGRPLNSIFGYKSEGLFQTEAEVLEYYNQLGFIDPANQSGMKTGTLLPAYTTQNRLTPGSVKRVDTNGDGTITSADLVYLGDANPHNSFGISLGAQYKGFDFSAFFQGVANQNIVRTETLAYPWKRWWQNQNVSFLDTAWTSENTGAEQPIMSANGSRNTWNYAHTNDINIIKARYLRAKVLSVGYTLPATATNKVGIERLRLSITGNDLFVLSNVKDGLDPEAGSNAVSGNIVPFTSTLLFGLELNF